MQTDKVKSLTSSDVQKFKTVLKTVASQEKW